jgi:hypothetical protein
VSMMFLPGAAVVSSPSRLKKGPLSSPSSLSSLSPSPSVSAKRFASAHLARHRLN